jgi:hypothetical protein
MQTEPDYVAQTAEITTAEELRAWQEARMSDAKAIGCTWPRWSYDGDRLYLFEAWKVRPSDEGAPRFAYAKGGGDENA